QPLVYEGPMAKRRKAPSATSVHQAELPLAATPRRRPSGVLPPEAAARLAIARRAKPSAIPGYVRLLLTLEVRRELAEAGAWPTCTRPVTPCGCRSVNVRREHEPTLPVHRALPPPRCTARRPRPAGGESVPDRVPRLSAR